jgi:hypothetical protein
MGLIPSPKGRRRLLVIAVLTIVVVAGGLWLWGDRLQQVWPNPALATGTQTDEATNVSHPDFRGDWQIDLQASEPVAPILRAKGKSALEINLASKVSSTQVIRGDQRRLTIVVKTFLFEQKEELLLDGTPTRVKPLDGPEAEAVTRWSEDGQSLITTTTDQAGGRVAQVTVTRSLDPDRRTMYVDLEYRFAEGEPIRVRRVFRLVRLPDDGEKA